MKTKQWKLRAATAAAETVIAARIKTVTTVVNVVKAAAVVKVVTLAVKAAIAVKNLKTPLNLQLNPQKQLLMYSKLIR
ncbi:MAG: hypothetical protein WC747_03675 [Candidatus Babeliales bacterium]|jgi:hypothetical protein